MDSPFFLYIVIIIAAVIHEYAHAFVANELGDRTAKMAGRLTLNPIVHIDLFGTIILPIILIMTSGFFMGWAKPVPYNPMNIRDPKGELKIAIAGPFSNFIIAGLISLIFLVLRFAFPPILENAMLISAVAIIIRINISIALFNLIPIPPLDGSKVLASFLPYRERESFLSIGPMGIIIALFIGTMILPIISRIVFNLFTGFGFIFGL